MADSGNIILTGFMGTGKTTVGRLLARHLEKDFVDSDELIEERFGPIPDIFADQGEERFRRIEREVALEASKLNNTVIATGGGLMLHEPSVSVLAATGPVFCLWADTSTIMARLGQASGRPLITEGEEQVDELLQRRRSAYERFTAIDTDGRTPDEVVEDILGLLD